jgi:hypothetical protein
MEQLVIKVNSDHTSSAIKKFVEQFEDVSIEEQIVHDDDYYLTTYGINKSNFENKLNIGIAQAVLGITRSWEEVKESLLSKIQSRENH